MHLATRFYVVDSVADRFVAKFVDEAQRIVVGDPRLPETGLGPVISAEALAGSRPPSTARSRAGQAPSDPLTVISWSRSAQCHASFVA